MHCRQTDSGVLAQKVPRGGRGTIKTLYVACATLWPPPALGTPLLACLANYNEKTVPFIVDRYATQINDGLLQVAANVAEGK